MRTFLSLVLLLILLAGGAYFGYEKFRANYLEDGAYWSANTVQLKSDKVGRLEAQGEDLRVYEFIPQTSPKKQCIYVAGTSKGGLWCWDKY